MKCNKVKFDGHFNASRPNRITWYIDLLGNCSFSVHLEKFIGTGFINFAFSSEKNQLKNKGFS